MGIHRRELLTQEASVGDAAVQVLTSYMYYNIKTERGVSKNEIGFNYGR